MARETSEWKTHKNQSTEARHRGGPARSRDEASVMDVERRGRMVLLLKCTKQRWEECMTTAKPYVIATQVVWDAYKKVQANRGAAGVDGQSLAAFEKDVKNNLSKRWNRRSSGSSFPPPVRRVEIPKGNPGATRPLGMPTVSERIAQMGVKRVLEPPVAPYCHPDAYGYRPGKSALDAVGVTRQRCGRQDGVSD